MESCLFFSKIFGVVVWSLIFVGLYNRWTVKQVSLHYRSQEEVWIGLITVTFLGIFYRYSLPKLRIDKVRNYLSRLMLIGIATLIGFQWILEGIVLAKASDHKKSIDNADLSYPQSYAFNHIFYWSIAIFIVTGFEVNQMLPIGMSLMLLSIIFDEWLYFR